MESPNPALQRTLVPRAAELIDEILRELAFARMIERGLEDFKANRTISNDEMKQRIKTWRR